MAEESTRALSWEATEHHHEDRSNDWYWALGVVVVAAIGVSIVFGNFLFAVVLLLGAATIAIFAMRGPLAVEYTIGPRGIRIGNELFPYTTLESFYIDEDGPRGPELLLKSERLFMPLIIVPLPPEYIDAVDDMLGERLDEEHLEESFFNRLLEFFGF